MKRPLLGTALVHMGLVVLCVIVLYPLLWVVGMALSSQPGLQQGLWPLPAQPSLVNFTHLLTAQDAAGHFTFWRQLGNSILVATLTTLVGLTFSVTAAYALSRFAFPGRRLGMTALLATQMFPATMMSVPLYAILDKLHLLNSLSGLVLVYATTSVPFCVWMLKGYFDTIPKDLEEAALLDGASQGQIFLKVVLPLTRPALAVTALFSFMTAWNEFVLAATFIDDQLRFTLPVALQRLVGEYKTEWGLFAAGALLVSAPVMAVFFALQKNLVGGLTAGGVKG
ncbi:MAG: sugar ABC transporter permease [Deltaproteobacteria bacterium]|nr:sugar ABC transporter permease [Deltaproteobacteria bacterium]